MPSVTWSDLNESFPSDEGKRTERSDVDEVDRWTRMVNGRDAHARQSVERAVKKWNTVIRECLRTETGFVLGRDGKKSVIHVEVSDGMPVLLQAALEVFKDPWAQLLLHQHMFVDTAAGIGQANKLLDGITQALRGASPQQDDTEAFSHVGNLMQRLNQALTERSLPGAILGLKGDVLGAYYCGGRRVKVYWVPICMLAYSEGWPIEELTFIVLAHELAHAYTNAGFDIDGNMWDNADFVSSDLELVEGLAQYYTETICKRCSDQLPKAKERFDAMLEKQSPVYSCYRNWNMSESGEAMRAFLISVSGRSRPRPVFLTDEE